MAGNRLSFSLFILREPHRVPLPKFIYEYLSFVSLSENIILLQKSLVK